MKWVFGIPLLLVLPSLSLAMAKRSVRPVQIIVAKSIAGVKPGMSMQAVKKVLGPLEPEGVERANRTGFISGPILVLFDGQDEVVLVSVELRKSPGLKVGKSVIQPTASLEEIKRAIPGCTAAKGSGGNTVTCKDAEGGTLSIHDSLNSPEVWFQLGPG